MPSEMPSGQHQIAEITPDATTLGEITLREHQIRAVNESRNAVAAAIQAGKPPRIVVCAPCGAGKTIISSAIIARCVERARKALFIARGRQLIYQKSRVLNRCGVSHAVLMDGEEDNWFQSLCTVASKDTYWARAFQRDKVSRLDVDLVILDEAHAMGSSQVLSMIPEDAVVIGLTATPVYPDGKSMGLWWTDLVIAAKYSELIAKGMIVPCRVFAPWAVDTRGLGTDNGDWSWAKVANRAKKLTGNVVESWIKLGQNRPTACFAQSVEHSVALCNEFNKAGIPALHIDADTPQEERDAAFDSVARGHTRVLCNFGVLTVGFDLPVLSCEILAFSTQSLVKYMQAVGRVLRSSPGKTDALVIDHGDNVRRFGWPTEDHQWSLSDAASTAERDAAARQRDDKPRELIACRECGALRESGPKCPNCGNQRVRQGHLVLTAAGELREIRQREAKSASDHSSLCKVWQQCLAAAAYRGLSYNAARGMFKKKTGQWPLSTMGYSVPYEKQNVAVSMLFPGFIRQRKPHYDPGTKENRLF